VPEGEKVVFPHVDEYGPRCMTLIVMSFTSGTQRGNPADRCEGSTDWSPLCRRTTTRPHPGNTAGSTDELSVITYWRDHHVNDR